MTVTMNIRVGSGEESTQDIYGPVSTIAALNALVPSPVDQDVGLIRTGSGSDVQDLFVTYDPNRNLWVSKEIPLVRCTDINGTRSVYYTPTALGFNHSTGLCDYPTASVSNFHRIDDWMTAGLGIEHRLHSYLKPDLGGTGQESNVYFVLYALDAGDQKPNIYSQPPAAAWAETSELNSTLFTYTSDWKWIEQGWTELLDPSNQPLTNPGKSTCYAVLVGYLTNRGQTLSNNAQPIDVGLYIRLVGAA